MNKKTQKGIKIALWSVGSLVAAIVVTVCGYVTYIVADYTRIADNQVLPVSGMAGRAILDSDLVTDEEGSTPRTFSASTYNIGFGAYGPDYDFFMDENDYLSKYVESHGGVTHTQGSHSRGISEESIVSNTEGAIGTIANLSDNFGSDVDFAFFQEVDSDADRSFHVNQEAMLADSFVSYDRVHSSNYHSSYLAYPFNEPIGQSNSGISTISRFVLASSIRKSFYVSKSFPDKFFDLDRCYSISRTTVGSTDKYLDLINVHMSAYDSTGEIRAQQFAQLRETLAEETAAGNYVIVAGDFNHDVIYDNKDFMNHGFYSDPLAQPSWYDNYEQTRPTKYWWNYLRLDPDDADYELKDTGMRMAVADNLPTSRDPSIPLQDANGNGIIDNFLCVIDGFMVSKNISVKFVQNLRPISLMTPN